MTTTDVAGSVRSAEDLEIVQAFLDESRENLDGLDEDLVALEASPGDERLLAQIFRTLHTIKGTCGFLGFERLEAMSHAGEDLLDALRSHRLQLDAGMTTSLLHLVDAVRTVLDRIDATGDEGDNAYRSVIDDLCTYARRPADGSPLSGPSTPPAPAPRSTTSAPLAPSTATEETPEPGAMPPPDPLHGSDSAVRVDVALLDDLMNLVGELVLTGSQLTDVVVGDSGASSDPLRRLRLVTNELRENVMQARLQDIGTLTAKFHRLARDLGESLGKRVRLETSGDDVGVDKGIHEALRDPLVHLVRNAVDHGIESPAARTASGKAPQGQLWIRASHRGDRVHIEVSDDGAGIDPRKLAVSAVRAGLVSPEAADALSDAEAINLIFVPGLTTKAAVSSVSGRGVGMDVVRSSLSSVGGTIEVSSLIGKGTTFRIDLPLTVAIIPIVVVRSGGSRYAIPQVYVREVVHLDTATAASTVSALGEALVLRRRGRLLPLLELASHLGVAPLVTGLAGADVVVVDIGGRRYGLLVDRVCDSAEAVVKPLPSATRTIPIFSGVTLLGDGVPCLILDLDGLANVAQVTAARDDDETSDGVAVDRSTSFLLAMLAGGGVLAIPLDVVRRLEQLSPPELEHSGHLAVVQYRGSVLPLLDVSEQLAGRPRPDHLDLVRNAGGLLQTVVCESPAGLVGLVVDRIGDVVTEPSDPLRSGKAGSVTARAVVAGHVVDVLRIEMLVSDAGLC